MSQIGESADGRKTARPSVSTVSTHLASKSHALSQRSRLFRRIVQHVDTTRRQEETNGWPRRKGRDETEAWQTPPSETAGPSSSLHRVNPPHFTRLRACVVELIEPSCHLNLPVSTSRRDFQAHLNAVFPNRCTLPHPRRLNGKYEREVVFGTEKPN